MCFVPLFCECGMLQSILDGIRNAGDIYLFPSEHPQFNVQNQQVKRKSVIICLQREGILWCDLFSFQLPLNQKDHQWQNNSCKSGSGNLRPSRYSWATTPRSHHHQLCWQGILGVAVQRYLEGCRLPTSALKSSSACPLRQMPRPFSFSLFQHTSLYVSTC